MTDMLARIHWKMGQSILPEFFVTQEDSLLRDSILRFRATGVPFYGIANLEWSDALISEGVVSINKMTIIMPSGRLLNVPENARLEPFNLGLVGSTKISLYCHFTMADDTHEEERNGWYDEEMDDIPRVYHRLTLSSEQNIQGLMESIKIAVFEKDPDDTWHLSETYVPPLLQMGTTLFFKKKMDELSHMLELFHYNLALEASGYLSGDSLINVKMCMKSSLQLQRLLANINAQIHCHPYYLYEALNLFYTEICYYKKIVPENNTAPYNHDKLADCFNVIIKPLMAQMQDMETKSPYLPFAYKNGIFGIKLPPEIRAAREVYFLVQKAHVGEKIDLSNMKLGCMSRISTIHRIALPGVPLRKTERPPFQHSFGAEVEFFKIAEGEEWDYALRELTLAFYHQTRFEEMEYFLYWR